MALKSVLENLDGIAEPIAALYTKGADDKYYLEVEGLVPKSKLDEFRETNIKLMKDMEKFKDVDPVKYRELAETARKIQEKEWIDKGEIDKVVEQRVALMREDFIQKESSLKAANEAMSRQLESLLIDNQVRDAATKLGVRPSAVDDVLLRAKTVYRVIDGVATPVDSKGQVIYGKDGTNPMTVADWVGSLKQSAEHLFQSSTGGGASGSNSSGASGANLTSVQKIAAGLAQLKGG